MADDIMLATPRASFTVPKKVRFGLLFAIGGALALGWYAAIGWLALRLGEAAFALATG